MHELLKSHSRLLKLGLDTNPVTATRLLNAYISTPSPNSLTYAYHLFSQVPFKDTVLWSSMLAALTQSGHPNEALQLFSQMHHQAQPNHFTFATAARACGSIADLRLAQIVHSAVLKSGFRSNVVVNTSILDMYSKCFAIESARKVFDEMPQRNFFSWNAMIAGYVLNGIGARALDIFHRMKCVEFELPDEFAVATAVAACAAINDVNSGVQIHAYIVGIGFESDPVTMNSVCNMYFRCGEVDFAERVAKGREESAVLKVIMIKGYVLNGRYCDVIKSIGLNLMEIVAVDLSVVVSILTVCANLLLLGIGRQVHGHLIATLNYQNCHSDDFGIFVGSALIDMYCNCASVEEARRVFDNLANRHVSHWNAMVTGYANNKLLEDARKIFDEMPERNIVSWTAMISGYVRHGFPHEGLRLLSKMYYEDTPMQGNCFTFATTLDACSCLTSLDLGKQIHAQSLRTTSEASVHNNVVVETALVDMYSKSGGLNYAQRVFDRMMKRSVVSWTSMITGYAIHGFGTQALEIFRRMLTMGFEPNEVTFVSVLSACSHCGMVTEGLYYFKLMKEMYGIIPRGDHYTCLVDLLGRAGKLAEALRLMEEIEDGEANDGNDDGGAMWGALLAGCKLHGNVEMGKKVAKKMIERNRQVLETFVALSNVYSEAGMWDEACQMREEWRKQGVVKEPGSSQIHMSCFG